MRNEMVSFFFHEHEMAFQETKDCSIRNIFELFSTTNRAKTKVKQTEVTTIIIIILNQIDIIKLH